MQREPLFEDSHMRTVAQLLKDSDYYRQKNNDAQTSSYTNIPGWCYDLGLPEEYRFHRRYIGMTVA